MRSAREVQKILEDRPDLEPAIEEVLTKEEPFQFKDLNLDSGTFGELVSRGIVVRSDEGYRVSDRAAVQHGLDGEHSIDSNTAFSFPTFPNLSISRLEVGFLVGALLLVVLFRIISIPTVFREGHVVLSSNDPYYYRYLVEQLLGNPDVSPSNLGGTVSKGEPLMVVTLWVTTVILGGTKEVAGHVLAWYPVVSAFITAVVVYAVTRLVTDDKRVSVAAVVMLGIIPVHAYRTSLGFADHHAFDYLWLALTLFALVLIARTVRDDTGLRPTTWTVLAATLLGFAISAQTLAWDNSPILLAGIGPVVVFLGLQAVYQTRSPAKTILPITAGLGLASMLTWVMHIHFDWHTDLVTSAPILLLVGGGFILVTNELIYRFGLPWISVPVVDSLSAGIGLLLLNSLRPAYWSRLTSSVSTRLLAGREIVEVQGIFGHSLGWLLLFGFLLLLVIPYLLWGTFRSREDPRWVPVVGYGWYFLVLAAIQGRFAGQLAIPMALFAGLGYVHLAERVDTARVPTPFSGSANSEPKLTVPSIHQLTVLVVLFALIGSLSLVQIPVKTGQLITPKGQSDVAFWIASDSDRRGLEYPQNYVLSNWGDNRMYNYFVNGESSSYGYARSHYLEFISSTDEERWYRTLDGRVGYIVTSPLAIGNTTQLGTQLQEDNASATQATTGLGHFRLRYIPTLGNYKVFELVPGAVISGVTSPNTTITPTTRYRIQNESLDYQRRTTSNSTGHYTVRVSQPGTYRVNNQQVEVNQSAIRNGRTVTVAG